MFATLFCHIDQTDWAPDTGNDRHCHQCFTKGVTRAVEQTNIRHQCRGYSNRNSGISAFAQTPGATPVASDLEERLLAIMEEMGLPGTVFAFITPDSPEPKYLELGVANLKQ